MGIRSVVFMLFCFTMYLVAASFCYASVDDVRRILSNRVVEDEIIIKSAKGVSKAGVSSAAASVRGKVVSSIEKRNLHLVKLPRGANAKDAIAQIKKSGLAQAAFQNIRVWIPENNQVSKHAKPGAAVTPAPVPTKKTMPTTGTGTTNPSISHMTNDPLLGYQWYLPKTRELITSNGLGTGAPIVAVVDTGVYISHPDLSGYGSYENQKVLQGYDFVNNVDSAWDDHGHGTHVAGIIAANSNNNTGIHGICPDCKILPVKVLDANGEGTWFQVAQGIDYADRQIDILGGAAGTKGIINMSLGGYADPNDETYIEALALAQSVAANNKLIVVSTGNENDEPYTFCQSNPEDSYCEGYLKPIPAGLQPYVLSVAASDPNDYRAYFSNSNIAYTNVVAPGRFILSTVPSVHYEAWDGTSMAAPIVSGAAARAWTQYPTTTASVMRSFIIGRGQTVSTGKGWPSDLRRIDIAWATGRMTTGIAGYVVNPSYGYWDASGTESPFQPINRATVTVKDGTNVVATAQTNQNGFFIVSGLATSKNYTVVIEKTGYVRQTTSATTGSNSLIVDLNAPVFMPTVKTAVAPFEEFMVSLKWDSVEPYSAACGLSDSAADCTDPTTGNRGAELDLYVSRPDGQIIYWNDFGDQYGAFTRDSFIDMMPGEGVYIKNLQTSPAGTYKIAVNRYLWGTMANVSAKVVLSKGTTYTRVWDVPTNCTQNWWVVATIDSATGNHATVNTCQDEYPFSE